MMPAGDRDGPRLRGAFSCGPRPTPHSACLLAQIGLQHESGAWQSEEPA
jgi:hypothetical protein